MFITKQQSFPLFYSDFIMIPVTVNFVAIQMTENDMQYKGFNKIWNCWLNRHYTYLQMASAVPLLSPVMTITRIPAARHCKIESFTSVRGGSSIPTTPTNVMLVYRIKKHKNYYFKCFQCEHVTRISEIHVLIFLY